MSDLGELTQNMNSSTQCSPKTQLSKDLVQSETVEVDSSLEALNVQSENIPKTDTGYAWVIMCASFMVNAVAIGLPSSFGIFQQAYRNIPELAGESTLSIAFIGSISIAGMPLFSIMSGRLVDKYGPRIVCICGAFITLASLILASFSTQLWHFLVTQGFLFGLGSSTAYLPSLAVLSDWWVKHRGLATGMAVAGAGIGGLAWGPVLRALITHIGWRWTLRIAGIASFVIVMVGAILLRIRLPRKAAASIDLSYFRESIFLRLYATTFITTFAYFIPFFFIPSYAINHGLSREQGALLLGLLNGASGLGRIALGFVADYLGCTNVMTSCLGLSATVILCVWPFATTFESLLALVIFFGFFVGGYISLLSTGKLIFDQVAKVGRLCFNEFVNLA
ncbi:hypothetical protein O5D80_002328 [Batrachochytrium dendrobatidis]|nr:hypothetical protein O5D80_002328 [Batrachochytrium dendrobatidis]